MLGERASEPDRKVNTEKRPMWEPREVSSKGNEALRGGVVRSLPGGAGKSSSRKEEGSSSEKTTQKRSLLAGSLVRENLPNRSKHQKKKRFSARGYAGGGETIRQGAVRGTGKQQILSGAVQSGHYF